GYSRLFANPSVNWMFESEPEPELEGRSMYQPRGKVLGGTSSINGMVYMRGNPADYDLWRQRGCAGWDWDSVLPYFSNAEDEARRRPNLAIRTNAHATRIIIENGRATGVEFLCNGARYVAKARGEIVVCGGVYGSPQLLQLSGLGPAENLQQYGVPVVRDMPV